MCSNKSAWLTVSSKYRVLYGTYLFLLFLVGIDNGLTDAQVEPHARVIGGEPAPNGRFPYMCSIRYRGGREHACGGTLIKSRWVLTAAHCVDPEFNGSAGLSPLIFCGIYERDEDQTEKNYSAVETHIHCGWNGTVENGFDIALIKLDKRANLALPDLAVFGHAPIPGRKFAALGWGENETHQATDRLQIVNDLIFVPRNTCNREETWHGMIDSFMICAGAHQRDTARGDSGGPLLQLDYVDGDYRQGNPFSDLVVGITTFGVRPPDSAPGVYTSIGAFAQWIDDVIKGDKEPCEIGPPPRPVPADDGGSAPAPEPGDGSPAPASESGPLCFYRILENDFDDEIALKRIREAIKEDDEDVVKEILVCDNFDPNLLYTRTDTFLTVQTLLTVQTCLLHEAAEYDAVKSTRVLIAEGADFSKNDSRLRSPLHVAAENSALKVAEVLVRKGADLEAHSKRGDTPLHFAAWWGFDAFAEFLLEKGANVNSRNDNGEIPLHLAASRGFISIVELLLENGASEMAETDEGDTPLDVICSATDPNTTCTGVIEDELENLLRSQ